MEPGTKTAKGPNNTNLKKKKKKKKIWKLLSTYKDSLTFLLQGKNVFVSKELYIWNTKY